MWFLIIDFFIFNIYRQKFNEFLNKFSVRPRLSTAASEYDGISTSISYTTNNEFNDVCLSEVSNSSYSLKEYSETSSLNEINLNVINETIEEPKKKNFLEKKNQIVPISNTLKSYKFKEDLNKNFSSLYVLNFVQDDDIFDYFRSLFEDHEFSEKSNLNKESNQKKIIDTSKFCKYIYMILENPNNKTESYGLGLKVVDISPIIKS